MAMYTTTVLADAAREGVRYAIVHGINNTSCSGPNTPNCADPDASGTRVKSVVTDIAKFSAHPIADTDVTITYVDGSNTPPNRVRVQINYQYVPWVRLPWTAPQLKAQAEGRIVN